MEVHHASSNVMKDLKPPVPGQVVNVLQEPETGHEHTAQQQLLSNFAISGDEADGQSTTAKDPCF